MRIFIEASSLHIVEKPSWEDFPLQCMHTISGGQRALRKKDGEGNVLCVLNDKKALQEAIEYVISVKKGQECHLVCVVEDKAPFCQYIMDTFPIVEAAGGLVRKGDALLFISRKGYWDLPKGKLEPGEGVQQAAVREVQEECSVSVRLQEKISCTYHAMSPKSGWMALKRVHWYAMDCLNDAHMVPRREEDIEEALWVKPKRLKKILKGAHPSVVQVVRRYHLVGWGTTRQAGRL